MQILLLLILAAASPSPARAPELALGRFDTCAWYNGGRVHCWGRSADLVGGLDGVVEVVIDEHGCARHLDGGVSCWGPNEIGQLGRGIVSEEGAALPAARVEGLDGVVALSVGGDRSVAVTEDGRTLCWGGGQRPSLAPKPCPPEQFTPSSCSKEYRCALTDEGLMSCRGDYPQPYLSAPNQAREHDDLGDTSEPRVWPHPAGIERIAQGPEHLCVTLHRQDVLCWGENREGALGRPEVSARMKPARVEGLEGVAALKLGDQFACARRAEDEETLWCWGQNQDGQLGVRTYWHKWALPRRFALEAPIARFDLGAYGACAVDGEGRARCWGNLMFNPTPEWDLLDEKRWRGVPDPPRWRRRPDAEVRPTFQAESLSVGAQVVCALRAGTGEVCCCDQLSGEPCRQIRLPGPAKRVERGSGAWACARLVDERLSCWRDDDDAPQIIESPLEIVDFTVGDEPCVLRADGDVRCGPPDDLNVVRGLKHAKQLSASGGYACALRGNGEVWCWGQLGARSEGRFLPRLHAPTHIALEGPARRVEVGETFACALLESGRVACWGDNTFGQIGISRRYRPVELPWREAFAEGP